MTGTGLDSLEAAGAGEPVNSRENSSTNIFVRPLSRCRREGFTEFEEVDACLVSTDVEVVVEQPTTLEAELCEIIPSIVAHEDPTAGF